MAADRCKVTELSKDLTRDALEALVKHEILAVRVRGWYERDACRSMAERILRDGDVRNWRVARGTGGAADSARVGGVDVEGKLSEDLARKRTDEESEVLAVGLPHNVAVANGLQEEYFAQSVAQSRKYREIAVFDGQDDKLECPSSSNASCLSTRYSLGPMDKLRLELDEIWPDGCMLMKDKATGLPHRAGIPRIMRPPQKYDATRWTRGFAHVDALELMRPDRGVYSANVYLQTPPSGGELLLWPISYETRTQFYRNAYTLSMCLSQDSVAQAYLRDRLPSPVVVPVQEGDLVVICTQRPHAVKGPIVGGDRVSMQGFLQYEKGTPLLLEA